VLGAGSVTPFITRVPPPDVLYLKHKSAALAELMTTRLRAVKINDPL
jgi:hypothetical protein